MHIPDVGRNQERMTQVVFFSGYFVNRTELCEELGINECPEEDILYAGFERWGTGVFSRLNGLFSAVLLDERQKRWYCCRDRFGGRGLYYALGKDGIPIFSETIGQLLRLTQRPAVFREELLEIYLSYSYIPGEETAFSGICKPLPGYIYSFEDGTTKKERYFTPRFRMENRSEAEWETLLEDALDSVFVGKEKGGASLLSSGIDSSYICRRLDVDDTYTAYYEDPDFSEASDAAAFSRTIGARHHTVSITPEQYLLSVPETMRALEQPSGDASAEVLLALCRCIKEKTAFCYSGEGADELFFGYHLYDVHALPAGQKLQEAGYIGSTNVLSEELKERFLLNYSPSRKMDYVKEAYSLAQQEEELRQAAMTDLLVWLNGNLLPNIFALGGATGLTLHTPYLDNRLYDLGLRIPPALQHNAGLTKKLFRQAAVKELDHESSMCPKRGFPVPIRLWLRRPDFVNAIRQAFASGTACRFFKSGELTAFLDEMLSNPEDRDSWRIIWCIYCFIIWFDEMIDVKT